MDDDTMADLRTGVDHHVRKQGDVLPNLTITRNVIPAHEHGSRPDLCPWADYTSWPDMRGGIDLRGGGDARARMNARGRGFVRWKKQRQHPCHGDAGIRHPYKNFRGRSEPAGHKDGRCRAGVGGEEVSFLVRERKVAGPRAVGGCEAS